ncbi:hypothetical protein AVEN_275043-1 [Araneus ventricosus]|uniref:Uncharacterized protein n=1 Tax=Araneus ventricosus TaxID=182803 RepID=A0A4Y2EUT5_ARAVE|nr:hypothetical protein AVEN_275043-1 [Araneus ventricosus]
MLKLFSILDDSLPSNLNGSGNLGVLVKKPFHWNRTILTCLLTEHSQNVSLRTTYYQCLSVEIGISKLRIIMKCFVLSNKAVTAFREPLHLSSWSLFLSSIKFIKSY